MFDKWTSSTPSRENWALCVNKSNSQKEILNWPEKVQENRTKSVIPWGFHRTMASKLPFSGGDSKAEYNAFPMKTRASYDISLSPWPCYSARSKCASFEPRKRTGWGDGQPESGWPNQVARPILNVFILRLLLLFWHDHGDPRPYTDWTRTRGPSRPGHDELVVLHPIFIRSSRCKHGWYHIGQVCTHASLAYELGTAL